MTQYRRTLAVVVSANRRVGIPKTYPSEINFRLLKSSLSVSIGYKTLGPRIQLRSTNSALYKWFSDMMILFRVVPVQSKSVACACFRDRQMVQARRFRSKIPGK